MFTQQDLESLGYTLQPDGSYQQTGSHHPPPARLPHPKPQPNPGQTLVDSKERKNQSKKRTSLIITRRAVSVLDADNFAGGCKPLIDQLRYARLIVDDDPASVEITFRQEKVQTKAAEMTTVEITTP